MHLYFLLHVAENTTGNEPKRDLMAAASIFSSKPIFKGIWPIQFNGKDVISHFFWEVAFMSLPLLYHTDASPANEYAPL